MPSKFTFSAAGDAGVDEDCCCPSRFSDETTTAELMCIYLNHVKKRIYCSRIKQYALERIKKPDK